MKRPRFFYRLRAEPGLIAIYAQIKIQRSKNGLRKAAGKFEACCHPDKPLKPEQLRKEISRARAQKIQAESFRSPPEQFFAHPDKKALRDLVRAHS